MKMNERWKQRPHGSTWGDWGEDDQLGRLNLIGAQQVLKGVSEVEDGKTFCLSLPLDYPGGRVLNTVRHPPVLRPVIRNGEPYYNYAWKDFDERITDIGSDDCVLLYTQYSTQWDSLAHRGSLFDIDGSGELHPVYYNGYRANEHITKDTNQNVSAHSLGIENMAKHGVQGRGVMVDLHSSYGDFPRKVVGYDDLMYLMQQQRAEIEEGDILCLWTGLDEIIIRMGGQPDEEIKTACAVLNGWDQKLLNWITDSGVSAIVSDNLAIEAVGTPLPEGYVGTSLPLHEHCLFILGVHLGELWHLGHLARWLKAKGRTKFMLTAPPLRLTGAVGSPVTPIATV